MTSIWKQIYVLLWKNAKVKIRDKSIWQELGYPIYFFLILILIRFSLNTSSYEAVSNFPVVPVVAPVPFLLDSRKVAFIPDSPITRRIADRTVAALDLLPSNVIRYSDESEFLLAYNSDPSLFAASIIFDITPASAQLPQGVAYTIRSDGTLVPPIDTLVDDQQKCRNVEIEQDLNCPAMGYIFSGHTYLQNAVNNAIMAESLGLQNVSVQLKVQKVPKAAFSTTGTSSFFRTISSIYIIIAFTPMIQFLLVTIVTEKESKIKEGMRMQGLSLSAYWGSWFWTYAALIFVISLVMTVLSIVGRLFANSNIVLIFVMFCLFGLSIIGFSFALTPFFNEPKLAGVAGTFSAVILSFLHIPLSGMNGAVSSYLMWGLSLFSPVALSLGIGKILTLEGRGIGVNFTSLSYSEAGSSYTVLSMFIMLAFDVLLYLFLAWYFDAVVPTPHGASRPWHFLFSRLPWFNKNRYARLNADPVHSNHIALNVTHINPDVESVSAETESRLAIEIKGLAKSFGSKVVLDGVNLKIYEGSIFGLLGHNGAGKSTLVSILTGITEATSGNIKIYDQCVSNNLESIRSNLGVVLQKDVLWNHLTVTEHVNFYGRLKGLKETEMQIRCNELLNELDLEKEKDTAAEKLSGGQKRKLSVAIAMIGNPKILILDEPTSGVDAYSRRKLWDILIRYKEDRVVLLTTHSMDEADILASRKAILSHGKVRCVGSSMFLKNRFGIGYHLNMVKSPDCDVSTVNSFIVQYIPSAKQTRNVGSELSFTLPYQSVSEFKHFFDALEDEMGRLGIDSFGLSMTTLEEVFLKLENEDTTDNRLHGPESPIELNYPQDASSLFSRQLSCIVHLRIRQKLADPNVILAVIFVPIVILLIGIGITQTSGSSLIPGIPLRYASLPQNVYRTEIPYNSSAAASVTAPLVSRFEFPTNLVSGNLHTFFQSSSNYQFGIAIRGIQPNGSAPSFNASILFNDTSIHSLPVATNILSNAVFAYLAESQRKPIPASYQITTINKPLPLQTPKFSSTSASSLILIGLSVSLAPAVFGVDVVKERVNKIRHQLLIMGTHPSSYWLGYLISDVLSYSVVSIAVIILVHIFNVEPLIGNSLLFLIVILIIYMPTTCLSVYCYSFLFKTVKDVQTWLPSLINLEVFVLYMAVAMVDVLNLPNIAKALHFIAIILFPAYSFVGCLWYFNRLYYVTGGIVTFQALLKIENVLSLSILFMILSGLIQGMGLMYLERRYGMENSQHRIQNWPATERNRMDEDHELNEDRDVYSERRRVRDCLERAIQENSDAGFVGDENDLLLAEGLRKRFTVLKDVKGKKSFLGRQKKVKSEKVVVKDLTIGVKRGECLGLLGPNGAGKSTSQNIITGQLAPTYANGLYIKGRCFFNDPSQSYRIMGFCPQADALWDSVTVYEHLRFYANIKLVKKECVAELVEKMITLLKIEEYRHVKAKDLSGGNKRKLSFAISIIGNPELLVLDECSTGMDPSSRLAQFMWNVVSSTAKDRACILTTHALEEADFLCTRIAIITNGELVALGSSQQLKSKHGQDTYQLEVKVKTDSEIRERSNAENSSRSERPETTLTERLNKVESFVTNLFVGLAVHRIDVEGEAGGRLVFKISRKETGTESGRELKVGDVFGEMESRKEELEVEEYAFMGVTLEQVFLEFARQQKVDQE
ncbi:hypothetical protein BKA69DRAFT_1081761 [Paraphysoderma sedebokerense]|nr:hypothetical protein BKA69DRAFT_1081761 [Paraphysoderma sedebokerense]